MSAVGFVKIGEAARALSLSKGTVSRLLDRGEIQYWVTPGGHRRIAAADLEDYARNHHRVPLNGMAHT